VGGKLHYPSCAKCGKNHIGGFLVGQKGFYGCGKLAHGIKECPYAKQGCSSLDSGY